MRGECGDHFRAFMAEKMAGHLMCAGTLVAHVTSLTFQLGDVANLQLTAAFNHRAVASDFHGLIHSLHIEYEKASNGFLRLREDAIGNGDSISSGDDFAFWRQRLGRAEDALLGEAVDPGVNLDHVGLHLFGRVSLLAWSTNKEHVLIGGFGFHWGVLTG